MVDGAEVAAVERIRLVPDQEELIVCQCHATLPRRHRSVRFFAQLCCRNVPFIDKKESVFSANLIAFDAQNTLQKWRVWWQDIMVNDPFF